MNSTRIGNLSLAPGQRPKIIVPIACAWPEEAVDAAKAIGASLADMAELRVDVLSETDLPALLDEIRNALAGKPLLFTFRTDAEGGADVSPERYLSLIQTAAGHDGVGIASRPSCPRADRARQPDLRRGRARRDTPRARMG